MINDGYYTLKSQAAAEITERRSVFIGHARPISAEKEARDFIGEVRAKHSDASHNVYAYLLREGNTARFSDDGEPGGTAGLPVLEVLRKEALTDCALVVTRYFGGTLLGAGGLVRAYSAAAKAAVEAAEKIFLKPFNLLEIRTDYPRFQRVNRLMTDFGVKTREIRFEQDVFTVAAVEAGRSAAFLESVAEATGASVKVNICGVEYDFDEGTGFRK